MSRSAEVRAFTGKKLSRLAAEAENGDGKAALAALRRGIGRIPGELPEIIGTIVIDMPEEFLSRTGEPTKEEWACYIALTMYAMHQQGFNTGTQNMNVTDRKSIGTSMSEYASAFSDANAEQRMQQRLYAMAASGDMRELGWHLKGIIQLLKSKGIPLNYAQLAGDLYDIQFPDRKPAICLRWGQDFYRRNRNDEAQ